MDKVNYEKETNRILKHQKKLISTLIELMTKKYIPFIVITN